MIKKYSDALTSDQYDEIYYHPYYIDKYITLNINFDNDIDSEGRKEQCFMHRNPTKEKLDNTKKVIKSMVFNISSSGEYKKKICSHEKVTLQYAVETMEMFLSQTVTPMFYLQIKDDVDWYPEVYIGLPRGYTVYQDKNF